MGVSVYISSGRADLNKYVNLRPSARNYSIVTWRNPYINGVIWRSLPIERLTWRMGLGKNRDNNKLRQVFQFSSHPLPFCSCRTEIITIVSTAAVRLILVEKKIRPCAHSFRLFLVLTGDFLFVWLQYRFTFSVSPTSFLVVRHYSNTS